MASPFGLQVKEERSLLRTARLTNAGMKYAAARPFAAPEAAARKLVEIASGIEPVQDAGYASSRSTTPFVKMGGSGDEFRAAGALAEERGWIERHESGNCLRLGGRSASGRSGIGLLSSNLEAATETRGRSFPSRSFFGQSLSWLHEPGD